MPSCSGTKAQRTIALRSFPLWEWSGTLCGRTWTSFDMTMQPSILHGLLLTACFQIVDHGLVCQCLLGATVVVESLEHLFIECSFACTLIDWFHTLESNYRSSLSRPTSREIRFFRWADKIPAGFLVLIALVRHQVWLARNFHCFQGLQPEPWYLLDRVKVSFCFLVHIQMQHILRSTFEEQWLAGGILGTVLGDGMLVFPDELR